MDGSATQQRADTYVAIPIGSVRTDTFPDFDIYTVKGDAGYVLYRRKDADLAVSQYHLKRLTDAGVEYLHVRESDSGSYRRYLEANLSSIVHDDSIETSCKISAVCESAASVVEDICVDPSNPASIQRAAALVHNTVDLLLQGRSALAGLISAMSRDYSLYSHSVSVCVYTLALAGRIEKSADAVAGIGLGALLHDVGLTRVHPDIIAKGNRLSPVERLLFEKHPDVGVGFLRESPAMPVSEGTLAIVAQHHERCDGSGFPRGLDGSQIHSWARIVAVTDTFASLTAEDPWREPMSFFEALKSMRGDVPFRLEQAVWREFVQLLGESA